MLVLGLILSHLIGVSLGLLGGGGSILTVPIVHYVLGVAPHDAIALSLIIVGTTSVAALVPHARAGTVRWRIGLAFGAASMAAAFAGGRLGAYLPGGALIAIFALVMLLAGGAMLARTRGAFAPADVKEIRLPRVLLIGLGVGLLTGTLGAGGGFVIVPALTLFGGFTIRDAVGTSLLVIALNSGAGVAGAASHATIDYQTAGLVSCVAIAGSVFGAQLGKRLSAQTLQRAFAWLVLAVGVAILIKELG